MSMIIKSPPLRPSNQIPNLKWDIVYHLPDKSLTVVHERNSSLLSVIPSEQIFESLDNSSLLTIDNIDVICCPTCRRPFDLDNTDYNSYSPQFNRDESQLITPSPNTKNNKRFLRRRPFNTYNQNIMRKRSYRAENYFNLLSYHEIDPALNDNENISSTNTSRTNSEFGCINSSPSSPPHNLPSDIANLLNENYYKRFFKQIRKIGSGAYGAVYLCDHHLSDIQLGTFAVKIVPVGDNKDWLLRQLTEVTALVRLHHPNIISYQHAWLEMFQVADFGPSVPCVFILMEYANFGNLADYITNRKKNLIKPINYNNFKVDYTSYLDEETEIWPFFIDIILGLRYLHHSGIIHRDIKPENMLLSISQDLPIQDGPIFATGATNDEFIKSMKTTELAIWNPAESEHTIKKVKLVNVEKRPVILISDFGQSESAVSQLRNPRTGCTGTMAYCAPELLFPSAYGEYLNQYDSTSDIFSLGMLLYMMAFSALPYSEDDTDSMDSLLDAMRKMEKSQTDKNLTFPIFPQFDDMPHRSPGLISLIKSMVSIDPRQRPDIDSIISNGSVILHDYQHRLTSFVKKGYAAKVCDPPSMSLDDSISPPTFSPTSKSAFTSKSSKTMDLSPIKMGRAYSENKEITVVFKKSPLHKPVEAVSNFSLAPYKSFTPSYNKIAEPVIKAHDTFDYIRIFQIISLLFLIIKVFLFSLYRF